MTGVRRDTRILLGSLALLLLLASVLPFFPAPSARADGEITLTGVYIDEITRTDMAWEFPYSDELFSGSALKYSHTLALSSLGMALSSFRRTYGTNVNVRQDEQILTYLSQAGFTDPETTDYDQEPTLHTVSTVIAQKQMRDEEGEFTLIAVGICGGAYQMEWLSNFTIGNKTRHEGFSRAAQNVEGRIFVYLAERRMTGRLKLWITGYSRAAAVANIVAADMTDYGPFGRENVFAYTFATPNTTKEPREGSYGNIYNIVGRMDIVPQVPLRGWGFSRYGTDLFLPCQETDSSYARKKPAAEAIYLRITGNELGNNPEVNHRLRTVLDFMLELCPDTSVYTEHMQDVLKDMWEHKTPIRLIADIAQLASDPGLVTDENRDEANELMNFMVTLIWDSFAKAGSILRSWSSDTGMAGNLAREHTPAVYISWLFSSPDPGEIYSTSGSYQRCVVEGDVELDVYDADGELRSRLYADGSVMQFPGAADDGISLFMTRVNRQSIVILPQDSTYILEGRRVSDEEVRYYCITYDTLARENAKKGYSVTLQGEAAGSFFVNTMENGFSEPDLSDLYDGSEDEKLLAGMLEQAYGEIDHTDITLSLNSRASFMYRVEKLNVFRLSWIELLNILIAVPIALLLILIIVSALLVTRHRRKKKRKKDLLTSQEA